MREFVVLAECLNYTQAAERLFISQPALTRHIADIEEEMGVELLSRDTHVRELTACGELVLKDFKKILGNYDTLLSRAQRLATGKVRELKLGMLRYGAGQRYAYPVVNLFQKRFPGTRLTAAAVPPNRIAYELKEGTFDIGINISSKFYSDESVEHLHLGSEKLCAMVRHGHPLVSKKSISPAELAQEEIVLTRHETDIEYHIRTLFKYAHLTLDRVVYVDGFEELLPTLENSNAVFIGTKLLMPLSKMDMAFVEIDSEDFEIEVSMTHLKENNNPAIADMIDCAKSVLDKNT